MLIVDAHLDLACSAMNFGRELRHEIGRIRHTEAPYLDQLDGTATVSFPALHEGGVRLVFGSLFAFPKSVKYGYKRVRASIAYDDKAEWPQRHDEAYSAAMRQLEYYKWLADAESDILLIEQWADVETVIASQTSDEPKIGIVVHMEGADPIRNDGELEMWVEQGLRSVGLAWDDTRYAPGQWRDPVGLPAHTYLLLDRMRVHNVFCDLTHMSERATFDVLEYYDGPIGATHANARALVPEARQLSDDQIRAIAGRNGMIGIAPYNRFLKRHHLHGDPKERVTVFDVVTHIDHMCQLLGNADHVGIGSDFDGGFGQEDIPAEMDSCIDMPKIATALRDYGYDKASVEQIMSGNWLRMLRRMLR
ncbi:MAG: dipeptidase [Candidatus Promineifilaceae bacterium]